MKTLDELEAALAAATPGEWRAPGFNSQGGKVACLLGPDNMRLVSGNFRRDDAKLIALLHNSAPALIECAKALRLFTQHGDPSLHKNPLVDMQRRYESARAALAKLEK